MSIGFLKVSLEKVVFQSYIVSYSAICLYTVFGQAKDKKKPWIIEDESGEQMYKGRLEGSQHGAYYILMIRERDFFAIPIDEWYFFCLFICLLFSKHSRG